MPEEPDILAWQTTIHIQGNPTYISNISSCLGAVAPTSQPDWLDATAVWTTSDDKKIRQHIEDVVANELTVGRRHGHFVVDGSALTISWNVRSGQTVHYFPMSESKTHFVLPTDDRRPVLGRPLLTRDMLSFTLTPTDIMKDFLNAERLGVQQAAVAIDLARRILEASEVPNNAHYQTITGFLTRASNADTTWFVQDALREIFGWTKQEPPVAESPSA